MEQRDVGIVPIVESQDTRRIVGVLTDRDIVLRVVAEGRDPNLVVSVHDIMTDDVVSCSPDADLLHVEELMKTHRVHRVLVCDEQRSVVGIIATADIARCADETTVGDTVKSITKP
ncbi:MAG: putative signal-transduction protein containing cAMP-binding and domain [Myxococcales bacterium]|nr:putative signal-transduction protein containing cAMP-binding and domain [Myxococcales bacterium]